MLPKLVRDNIPEIIEKQGHECTFKILNEYEYHRMLIVKLQEEIQEFVEAETINEMADVVEVIVAILEDMNVTESELREVMKDKANRCGKFKRKVLLEEII